MSDDDGIVRHVTVRGRVQGVGYRAFVERAALARGLEGWVRNRADGSVEAVFIGERRTVAAMIDACRRGPAAAEVTGVDARDASAREVALRRPGERFSVLATA